MSSNEQLSFLPPPPFNPAWPKPGTRDAIALDLFMAGRRIDTEDFLSACGSWRLSDAVLHLRDMGWPIEAQDVPAPTAALANRTISIYFLPAKYIAAALATNLQGAAA